MLPSETQYPSQSRKGVTAFIAILMIALVVMAILYIRGPGATAASSRGDVQPDTLNAIITIKGTGSIEEVVKDSYPGYHVISGGVISSVSSEQYGAATTLRLVIAREKSR
jgi:hypothetical protein